MIFTEASLYASPNALAPHYTRFNVAQRLLLTGHSHQAWPDVAEQGHMQAFEDAARYVDGKWEHAFERAKKVQDGYARIMGDTSGSYALSASTHDLVVKLLSALPLKQRPRIVTTDGEFHTLRRQFLRLEEEGIEIVRVSSQDPNAIANLLIDAINSKTCAVFVSAVLFKTGRIVPHLNMVQEACLKHGVTFVVDAYHALNVAPFSVAGLEQAYIVGGGYKYCQLGEGNAFLRAPQDCSLRPIITGWFAELFETLAGAHTSSALSYPPGADRFAGGTYDPTSHYRGAAVFDFFAAHQLTPEFLRRVSQHQMRILTQAFDALDVDPKILQRDKTVPLESIAGFLALRSPQAGEIRKQLLAEGVVTDCRDDILRLGPAPYLSDAQILNAVEIMGATLSKATIV